MNDQTGTVESPKCWSDQSVEIRTIDVTPAIEAAGILVGKVAVANDWIATSPTALGAECGILGSVVAYLDRLERQLDEIGIGPRVRRGHLFDDEVTNALALALSMVSAASRQIRSEVDATCGPAKPIPQFSGVGPLRVALTALTDAKKRFDEQTRSSAAPPKVTIAAPASVVGGTTCSTADSQVALKPFEGGSLIVTQGRIELCGVHILSGARQAKSRRLIELLSRESNGAFGADGLAKALGLNNEDAASSLVRRARNQISKSLRAQAQLDCGEYDVILSRGTGYRLASSISVSVQLDGCAALTEILAHCGTGVQGDEPINEGGEPINAPINLASEPISNSPNELGDAESNLIVEAARRQEAILQLLGESNGLRVPAIVETLGFSTASVKRDISELLAAEKIKFDGAKKTGGYVLTGMPAVHADKRTSRSTAPTSDPGPSAESR